MPIYEYEANSKKVCCAYCATGFDKLQSIKEQPLTACPECGAPVHKCISAPAVGASQSGFDDRAKSAGFHKLKKTGKGEYEKQY
jgi:putative FmdB family regulatory protein